MLCAAALLSGTARANKTIHRVETRLALGLQGTREELASSRTFLGPGFDIVARYGLCRGPHAFDVGIQFGSAPTWAQPGDSAVYVHNEIYLAYVVRSINRARRALWLGTLVRSTHEFVYLAARDEDYGYWLDAIMLGPSVRYAQHLRPALALELAGDVSLLGVASRPPAQRSAPSDPLDTGEYHFDRLREDPRFAWLGTTSLLRAEAVLRWRERARPFGSGMGIGIEARVAFAAEPAPYLGWYVGIPLSFAFAAP